jgi:SAM-dependent methyltransferase/methyltransferase-like protein
MSNDSTSLNSARHYDEVPYPGLPVARSQPEWLATVGKLRGMQPADAAVARVLELGCASGQNLIPLAERAPQATFLGIDYSARQIALAQEAAADIGLTNITFRQQNILDLEAELGTFDYIVAHGVYSWVDADVRDKLMAACRRHLAPQGIAYVSYNTYPGWQVHDLFRAMMKYEGRNARGLGEKLSSARKLLEFLQASLTTDAPYDALLQSELSLLLKQGDDYLRHDHLEEVNHPVYFRHFMAHARTHELQLLGEGTLGIRSTDYLDPEAEQNLNQITDDPIEKEQYRDIVRNRTIRQTLLCHQAVALERGPTTERLQGMYIESHLKSDNAEVDATSPIAERFSTPGGLRVSTAVPLIKAALVHLGEIWPNHIPFEELVAVARARIEATTDPPTPVPPSEIDRLEDNLLQCCAGGIIEVHSQPPSFTPSPTTTPTACPAARWQAARGEVVTTRRHQALRLEPFDQHLLSLVDGSRDAAKLLDDLTTAVTEGRLAVWDGQQHVTNAARAREILSDALPGALTRLAQNALLVS